MKKILKFYSETCAPCKVMSRRLEQLKDVSIQGVDIACASNDELLNKWKIRAVPTIIVLEEDGTYIAEFKGIVQVEEIQKVIDGGQTVNT